MTPLKDQSKEELVEKLDVQYWGKTFSDSSEAREYVKAILGEAYSAGRKAGLREAMGVVPVERFILDAKRTYTIEGWNDCRTETLQAIEKLI